MPNRSKMIWLVRHADTEWSLSGRHTSRTDLPLVPRGEDRARALAPTLARENFELVLTSPLQRARQTASLTGFGERAVVDENLREWNYGDYEGLTTDQVHARDPSWDLWTSLCPNGESIDEVAERCRAVVRRLESVPGNVLVFAHGHVFRMLAAMWLDLPEARGRSFALKAASISVLGYEHGNRVVWQWDRVDAFEGH